MTLAPTLALVLALALVLVPDRALVHDPDTIVYPTQAPLVVDAWVVWWEEVSPYSVVEICFSTIAIPVIRGS